MRYVLLGLLAIGAVVFFEVAGARDHWRICRSLGHSAAYCSARFLMSTN